jgi:excisionase family DNA binding protein
MVSRYFPASWISRSGPVRARDCTHASPRTWRARYSKSVSVRVATSRRTRPLCTVRAVDPDTVGRKLAAQRVAAAPVPVEYALHGEELPLDDDSIDHASTTWTISSYGAVALSVRRDLSLDGLRPDDRERVERLAADLAEVVARTGQVGNGVAHFGHDALMTYADAAAHLGVSARTVRSWCAEGKLLALRLGASPRIRRSELGRFVKESEVS